MLRPLVLLLALTAPALGQVLREDQSLRQQLMPGSFKLTATAASHPFGWRHFTTINYAIQNDSGMNLEMALLDGSVSLGTCSDLHETRGALAALYANGRHPQRSGRPAFVPAGARISGTIVLDVCETPNPGFPTAPLSLSLLLRRDNTERMVSYPLSIDAPIRRLDR